MKLLNDKDLKTLFNGNNDINFRKNLIIQLRQKTDIYKAVVDFKINSIINGGALGTI